MPAESPSVPHEAPELSSGTSTIVSDDFGDNTDLSGGSLSRKRLALTFRHITVRVNAADNALGGTFLSEFDPRQILDAFGKQGQDNSRVRFATYNINYQRGHFH